ncbi:MAG: hypothetical protein FJ222_10255 [Lentisphaerae bacterium]|nr:hypothetical protein [Lentisphaerota bacterium]
MQADDFISLPDILRAVDQIAGIPAVGAGFATIEDLLSGDSGTPLLMDVVCWMFNVGSTKVPDSPFTPPPVTR